MSESPRMILASKRKLFSASMYEYVEVLRIIEEKQPYAFNDKAILVFPVVPPVFFIAQSSFFRCQCWTYQYVSKDARVSL